MKVYIKLNTLLIGRGCLQLYAQLDRKDPETAEHAMASLTAQWP